MQGFAMLERTPIERTKKTPRLPGERNGGNAPGKRGFLYACQKKKGENMRKERPRRI